MMMLLHVALAAVLLRKESSQAAIADGYSRVGCYQDGSPDAVRLTWADGKHPADWSRKKMAPDQCFQFCRDKPAARFFGIANGRDCYCTEYFHDISTGGGSCDLPCEGDVNEMCGGAVKASLFEMHSCGNNLDLAAAAAQSAIDAGVKAEDAAKQGMETYEKMRSLADSWQLPVCSKAASVCQLSAQWEDQAQEVYDAALRARIAANETTDAVAALRGAAGAGTASNSSKGMLAVEQGVAAAREAMSAAAVKTTVVEMALAQAAGPLAAAEDRADFGDLFKTGSTRKEKGWMSVCALTPIQGKNMVAVDAASPAKCGDVCVSAGDDCVGIQFQAKGGLVACQLLSSDGVFEQDMSLLDAFGVFEVSKTKVEAMGLDAMDCFLKQAFLVRDGGLKIQVLDEVFVEA